MISFCDADDSLDSDPDYGVYNHSGYSHNTSFVEDSRVGSVLSCSKVNALLCLELSELSLAFLQQPSRELLHKPLILSCLPKA